MLYELVMMPPPPPMPHHSQQQQQQQSGVTSGLSPVAVPQPVYVNSSVAMQNALTGAPISKLLPTGLLTPVSAPAVASTTSAAAAIESSNNSSLADESAGQSDIFVGDLAPEVENHQLREAFAAYGIVTECKIIKDMHTQKPKGYGFVAFANRDDAQEALRGMQGRVLGSRAIRTNWAVRKPAQTPADPRPLDYEEVLQAASVSNCTVYVGGIVNGLCEELVRNAFNEFGEIHEVRIFKDKGYAFIRFDNHEAAARAIVQRHGREVGDQACKCSWGKECNLGGSGVGKTESGVAAAAAATGTSPGLFGYYGNPGAAAAAVAAAAATVSMNQTALTGAMHHIPTQSCYSNALLPPTTPLSQQQQQLLQLAAYQHATHQQPQPQRPAVPPFAQPALGYGSYCLPASYSASGSAAALFGSNSGATFCHYPIVQPLPPQLGQVNSVAGRPLHALNHHQQQQQQQHQFVPNPNVASFQPAI